MGFAMKHWVALIIVGALFYWLGTRGTLGAIPGLGGAAPVAG